MRRRLLQAATVVILIAATLGSHPPAAAALPDPPTDWPETVYVHGAYLDPAPEIDSVLTAAQIAQDAADSAARESARQTAEIAQSVRTDRLAAISAAAWHRLPDWLLPLVADAADAWDADPNKLARIVVCESGGNPDAHNPSGASGLTQQLAYYWPARATAAGLSGASVWDPAANLAVAAMMLARTDIDWNASRTCWR